MEQLTLGIGVLFAVLAFIYLMSIVKMLPFWMDLKSQKKGPPKGDTVLFSIVVPFRNEHQRLEGLVHSLKVMDYPRERYEVVWVNDHSTDQGEDWLEQHLHNNDQLLHLPEGKQGKKSALEFGIAASKHPYIITVDADITLPLTWLAAIAGKLEIDPLDFLILPVAYSETDGALAKGMALDFLSLQGITFGTAAQNKPIVASGANLCYKKSVFDAVGGFDGIRANASGDDVLLLHKLQLMGYESIGYLCHQEVLAETPAPPSLTAFIAQRARWAGKAKAYQTKSAIGLSWLVAAYHLLWLLSLLTCWYTSSAVWLFVISWGVKWVIDFLLLFLVAFSLRRRHLMRYFAVVELAYPFYIVAVLFRTVAGKHQWKGRSID